MLSTLRAPSLDLDNNWTIGEWRARMSPCADGTFHTKRNLSFEPSEPVHYLNRDGNWSQFLKSHFLLAFFLLPWAFLDDSQRFDWISLPSAGSLRSLSFLRSESFSFSPIAAFSLRETRISLPASRHVVQLFLPPDPSPWLKDWVCPHADWQAGSQSAGYLCLGVTPRSPHEVSWSALSAAFKELSYVLEANLALDLMSFCGGVSEFWQGASVIWQKMNLVIRVSMT